MNIKAAITAFIISLCVISSAYAGPCYKTQDVKDTLKRLHGEKPSITGVSMGSLIVIYVSDKGTFTIVRQFGNGTSCLLHEGKALEVEIQKGDGV